MKTILQLVTATLLLAPVPPAVAAAPAPDARPNFVFINIDDLGYADIGPFGSALNRTPNLDRMAKEGRKLTCFYAAPSCSPSRAGLMTGCYPKRVLPIPGVLFPAGAVGLNPLERTVAEVLKDAGYRTACVGKWHLGDQAPFLPTAQGFDHYLGIPYSNDMGTAADGSKSDLGEPLPQRKAGASDAALRQAHGDEETGLKRDTQPPLPLVEDGKVIARVKQDGQQAIVETYTTAAVKFLRENRDHRFFLYLPHNAVHFPLYPGKGWAGKSGKGLYTDWVEEVDWSVGQVLDTLRELGLDRRTLVIFTSDNGGTPRASNAPLRGHKGSTWEGGMRVPMIAWWPGRIPAGTSTGEIAAMLDILPTFATLAGGQVPADRKLDGIDLSPLLLGAPGAKGHDGFHFFRGFELEAVRSGPWKLHLGTVAPGAKAKNKGGPKGRPVGLQLFNLDADIAEATDIAASHPDVVARLKQMAEAMESDLGTKTPGPGVRPLGRVEGPQPFLDRDGNVRADAIGERRHFP